MADALGGAISTLCGTTACFGSVGIFFLFFFGIIGISLYFSYTQNKARNADMARFASENGLSFTPGGWFSMPSLRGSYKGHQMEMGYFQQTEGSGKHRHSHTYFYAKMMVTSAPQFYLTVSREGLMSWLGKSVGLTSEIEMGVPEFDKKYLITTNNALRAKRILSQEMRAGMERLMSEFGCGAVGLNSGALYIQREIPQAGYAMLKLVAETLGGLATGVDSY